MGDAAYETRNAVETIWRIACQDYAGAALIQKAVHDNVFYWSMILNAAAMMLNIIDAMSKDERITCPDGMRIASADQLVTEMRAQLSSKRTDTSSE
jgi:hypothetical protein